MNFKYNLEDENQVYHIRGYRVIGAIKNDNNEGLLLRTIP